ncbi:MAG: hypothetical protein ABII79_07150 [bacterium]
MNVFERIEKIRALLSDANSQGKIESKKKLHKLVYLLQQSGENFDEDFIFHHYGVFSPTLARDLEFAEKTEQIEIEKPQAENWGYTIKLPPDRILGGENRLSNKSREHLIPHLADKEPQLLETLSTIVYLKRNYYNEKDLKQKLSELKPDLSQHYEEAFHLAKELFQIDIKP